MLKDLNLNKKNTILLLIVYMVCTVILGYFTERDNAVLLFITYFSLFFVFFILYVFAKFSFKEIIVLSILFRLTLLFSTPLLSDDYFRFLWDGNLLLNAVNPYSVLPPEIANNPSVLFPLKSLLFEGLNELQRSNYTCYTPLNQLFFLFPVGLFQGNLMFNIIAFRLILILADIGTIFFSAKLLHKLNIPLQRVVLFAFNPLILLELTGNLHNEGIMIFFLVAALYFFFKKKIILFSVFYSLAVSFKLIPIVLFPALFLFLAFKERIKFTLISGILMLALLSPIFISNIANGFFESINLYFQSFEFNASIYYIARQLGIIIKGYNMISVIGPLLSVSSALLITVLAIYNKKTKRFSFIQLLVLSYAIFFFFSTTVHPWYIIPIAAMAVFSQWVFPTVWTALIFFSYIAYNSYPFTERTLFLVVEYFIVFVFIIYDIFFQKKMSAYNTYSD